MRPFHLLLLPISLLFAFTSAAPNPQATDDPTQTDPPSLEIDFSALTDFGAFTSFIDSLFPGLLDTFTAFSIPSDISFNPGDIYSSILSEITATDGGGGSGVFMTDVPSFTIDESFLPTETETYTGSNGGNLITLTEDVEVATTDATGTDLVGNTRGNVFTNTGVATGMTGSFTGEEAAGATETGTGTAGSVGSSKGRVVDLVLVGVCMGVVGVVVVL